jgi:hypothetical protein
VTGHAIHLMYHPFNGSCIVVYWRRQTIRYRWRSDKFRSDLPSNRPRIKCQFTIFSSKFHSLAGNYRHLADMRDR